MQYRFAENFGTLSINILKFRIYWPILDHEIMTKKERNKENINIYITKDKHIYMFKFNYLMISIFCTGVACT